MKMTNIFDSHNVLDTAENQNADNGTHLERLVTLRLYQLLLLSVKICYISLMKCIEPYSEAGGDKSSMLSIHL